MNELGISLAWMALLVGLLCTVGLVVQACIPAGQSTSGSAVTGAAVLGALVLSLLGFAPWPRWQWDSSARPASSDAVDASSQADARHGAASPGGIGSEVDSRIGQAAAETRPFSWWVEFWNTLRDNLAANDSPDAAAAERWRWQGIGALVVALGAVLFLARFAWGLAILHRYRRESRVVRDGRLVEVLSLLRNRLALAVPVELRESDLVSSPATLGWRRPIILFPADWRQWKPDELQAVLAHELAHIKRGDYLLGIIAHGCQALHFYHPLDHALVQTLRLQQELAADAWGARLAGGRDEYLHALARLALRHNKRPVIWAARAFFPRQDTFLRRIEMLRRIQSPLAPTAGRPLRIAVVLAVFLTVVSVAGLRPPGASPAGNALGQQAPMALPASRFDISLVPADAFLVLAARPAKLLQRGWLKSVIDASPQAEQLQLFALKAEEIDEVTAIFLVGDIAVTPSSPRSIHNGHEIRSPIVLIRGNAPIKHQFLEKTGAKEGKALQLGKLGLMQLYEIGQGSSTPRAIFFPDERTIGFGDLPEVERYALRIAVSSGEPAWADAWRRQSDAILLAAMDHGAGQPLLTGMSNAMQSSVAAVLSPMLEEARYAVTSVQLKDGITIRSVSECRDEEGAKKVLATIQAVVTLAKNAMPQLQKSILAQRNEDKALLLTTLLAEAKTLLDNFESVQEGNVVRAGTHSNYDVSTMLGLVLPAVIQAQEASARAQSANHLKQLALAMLSYHDAHRSFPPAVLVGPDGKTPHSWRVAILPYLGEEELYRKYSVNEPWNSENNLKVTAQMPAVYRSPQAKGVATNHASYYAITGPGTVFDGPKGKSVREIIDGTSHTIFLVEANREVPWTKPEDIAYDPNAVPEFGGFFKNGYFAAFCDGSVRFIDKNIAPEVLHSSMTAAGGDSPPRP